MKNSEKLVAYKKAQKEHKEAITVVNEMYEEMSKTGKINISSNLNIDLHSSQYQFLYALGILNNQIAGCPLLNLPDDKFIESRDKVIALWKLMQEYRSWVVYAGELREYEYALEDLLDDDDRFQLLEYPVKK